MDRLQQDYCQVPRKGGKGEEQEEHGEPTIESEDLLKIWEQNFQVWVMREHGEIMKALGLKIHYEIH